MAAMDREISKLSSKEVQRQIEDQLKQARAQIDAADKQMEQERVKMKEHPEPLCTGDCGNAPQ